MKKSLLTGAVLCALSASALATTTYGDIKIDGKIANEGDLGKVTNTSVEITKDGANAVKVTNEQASIRGKFITIDGSGEGKETIRLQRGATAQIGGEETEKLLIKSKEDVAVFATSKESGVNEKLPSKLDLQAKNIVIESGYAGIWAQNNTEVPNNPNKHTTINITADKTTITAQKMGIVAFSNSEINVSGDLTINAEHAIDARGNSIVNINQSGKDTVVLNGDIVFETPGNKDNSGETVNADININLTGANSSWTGNVVMSYPDYFENKPNKDELTSVKAMNVTLSGGAQWTPTEVKKESVEQSAGNVTWTQHSQYQAMNDLTLDGGVVNITGDNIDVTVENMTGSGTINLAVDGDKAGKFTVQAAKDASLDVNLMDAKMENELSSDDINAEQAKALLMNVGSNKNGESIVETKTEVKEGLVNPGFGVAGDKVTTGGANTLMQSSLELASAAPLALNRIMMNDVRKRLGDIRTSNGTHGAWARYDGGKLSGEGGLKNDFRTIQVGIDTVPTADAPRMGVAFSYTDSDAEYARGSADMKAYSLAMYSTWMGDNGQFFDLIGRMGTADTDMVVDGQHKGSMDNVALSMSGEFGWRFDVTDSIYVEPQVEATYTYVNEDSLSLSTANYDVDAVHSLLGRIGFAAGMKCPSDFGNVYVRASAVHEFLGDSKITGVNAGNTNVYEIDGKDTWFEYGIGANFNITKSTYMWADVERTTGGALDEDWRATVGVRYAW